MNPTKQDWRTVQDELSSPYGMVFLRCDGYLVGAHVEQSKMKLIIAVYINGVMSLKHQWTGKESEIGNMTDISRRFWCWHKKNRSTREIKLNERIFGKRECKKRGLNEGFIYTVPYFSSPGSFINHIKKHNEQIEILSFDEYTAARDQLKETESND